MKSRPLREPPAPVTVLVPTLNEADYVADCLRSLRAQTLVRHHPHLVEIVLVDSGSEDPTRDVARPLVDRIVGAPRGKINALHAGIESARTPLIAEADADGIHPPHWLEELLAPFCDPRVVGVHGPVCYYDSPVARHLTPALHPLNAALGKFPGGARAYRRGAYEVVGGFNLRISQDHLPSLWLEEEFAFAARLRRLGDIRFEPGALCFKSARRFDPLFVRDHRASRYRESVDAGERFGMLAAHRRARPRRRAPARGPRLNSP